MYNIFNIFELLFSFSQSVTLLAKIPCSSVREAIKGGNDYVFNTFQWAFTTPLPHVFLMANPSPLLPPLQNIQTHSDQYMPQHFWIQVTILNEKMGVLKFLLKIIVRKKLGWIQCTINLVSDRGGWLKLRLGFVKNKSPCPHWEKSWMQER